MKYLFDHENFRYFSIVDFVYNNSSYSQGQAGSIFKPAIPLVSSFLGPVSGCRMKSFIRPCNLLTTESSSTLLMLLSFRMAFMLKIISGSKTAQHVSGCRKMKNTAISRFYFRITEFPVSCKNIRVRSGKSKYPERQFGHVH